MKITEEHLMRDLAGLECILKHDNRFMDKIAEQSLPELIGDEKVRHSAEIPLQYIIVSWDTKDNGEWMKLTAKSFGLKGDVNNYPLIDFLRLSVELGRESEKAANAFKTLKREIKDERLRKAMEGIQTSPRAIFVEIMQLSGGAYTQDMAADLSWVMAFDILQKAVGEYDRQQIQTEIMEEDMKHGNK